MKKYLALLSLLIPVSSFAASKCLTEIKTTCPDHSKRDQCLRENVDKFSAPCVQTVKDLIGTETKATETATAESTPPPVAKIQIAPANDSAVGPCAEDFNQFCVTLKKDVLAVQDCMKSHWKELKPECQKESQVSWGTSATVFRAPKEPKESAASPKPPAPPTARMDSGAMENCDKEIRALCPMKKSEGQEKCMQDSTSRLSPECRTLVQNLMSVNQTVNKAKAACADDARRLCPTLTDTKQKLECLRANLDKVSPDCKPDNVLVLD